eukprot:scaffold14624_cov100-Cylindrotheca_fusiformis.AAC.10
MSRRNEKSQDNCSDELVPIAFAAAPLGRSGDYQRQQATCHEEQQIPSPGMNQAATVDEHLEQGSASPSSPLGYPQQVPEALVRSEELDPCSIQVVTFDEPADTNTQMGTRRMAQTLHQQHNPLEESMSLLPLNNGGHRGVMEGYIQGSHDDCSGHPRYHDIPWAVAFWAHFATVLYLGIFISPKGMHTTDDFGIHKVHDFLQHKFVNQDDFTDEDLEMLTDCLHDLKVWWALYPPRIMVFSIVLVLFSFCLNILKAMALNHMERMVRSSLVLSIVVVIVVFGIGLLQLPSVGFFCIGSLMIGVLIWFIRKRMWPSIHFAAINFQIAIYGLGNNMGTYILAILYSKLAVAWDNQDLKVDLGDQSTICGPSVTGNTAQVYVAGVMATWCFDKETARGWFSPAVTSSMYRSLTFSAGPIAFGSLLQGSCKTIRSVLSHSKQSVHTVRDIGDDCRCCCFGVGGLILDCISDLVGDALDYFTQWAYVFVGIYGHSYLESGKEAMELFRSRGFVALITDRLVLWCLCLAVFFNGILTGLASILLERLVTTMMGESNATEPSSSYVFGVPPGVDIASFLVGFVVGCVVTSVFKNVIGGAISTLIVCWAESPTAIMANHEEWAKKIMDAWSSVYPDADIQPRNGYASTSETEESDEVLAQSGTTLYGAISNSIV